MGQTTSSTAIWLVDAVLGQPEDLPQLADVERVLPQVIRVLGQNPGQLTLQGTNTYLVGTGPQRVLIDTSDGNSYWWPLIQQVLSEEGAEITEVLLTHSHYDHMGNMFEVRSSFPQASIHKWLPCVLGDKDCEQFTAGSLAKTFSKGRRMRGCGCDGQVPPGCQSLYEGQVFAAGDRTLRVLLTLGALTARTVLVLRWNTTTGWKQSSPATRFLVGVQPGSATSLPTTSLLGGC
ncbi:unnamed protein product [Effrenium voratum]|nr:unnamed protein product [Effrenium voratum]